MFVFMCVYIMTIIFTEASKANKSPSMMVPNIMVEE